MEKGGALAEIDEEDTPDAEVDAVQQQCVELLNDSALSTDAAHKVLNLNKLQELVVRQRPTLLDSLLDEVVAFQNDSSADVRRTVVGFIEEACQTDCHVIPRVVASLSLLLHDRTAAVSKRTIQAVAAVYTAALRSMSTARVVTEQMQACWTSLCALKREILTYLDHDNDGVRTMTVKFIESLVLLQTHSEADGLRRSNFCLDSVPMSLRVARPRRLEDEARSMFQQLITFHGSVHIGSVNLMACMSTLTLLARCRPSLAAGPVVAALEALHASLPPTLAKSQVSSVRKHMKMQLLNLLKQPATAPLHHNICALLTDLGASQAEVMRAMPPPDQLKKRQRHEQQCQQPPLKRPKLPRDSSSTNNNCVGGSGGGRQVPEEDAYDDDYDDEEYDDNAGQAGAVQSCSPSTSSAAASTASTAVSTGDSTAEAWVMERLTSAVTVQLVLASMPRLPAAVPPQFSSAYTPISAAGTRAQISHVSRLLAAQLSRAGLITSAVPPNSTNDWEMDDAATSVPAAAASTDSQAAAASGALAVDSVSSAGGKVRRRTVRVLKLSQVTRPLSSGVAERLITASVDRLMAASVKAGRAGLSSVHTKLVTSMATHVSAHLIDKLLLHILEDISSHADLCMAWLYEEYAAMLGFSQLGTLLGSRSNYEQVLCMLASALLSRPDLAHAHSLLQRIYLQAPSLPDSAVEVLAAHLSAATTHSDNDDCGVDLLQQLVLRRPRRRQRLAAALVELASGGAACEQAAMTAVLQLYPSLEAVASAANDRAVAQMQYLALSQPPAHLSDSGGASAGRVWSESLVRRCLRLMLQLLPVNESLINRLAEVYVQTSGDVKRSILRVVEVPVRSMGTSSPQLLSLVEQCPKGAETLVTRVIYILTDRCAPSPALVMRVRQLYEQRVSDVRFLIPVLTGLSRDEVLAALPKLIKLNPGVVKEVFARLLGIHSDSSQVVSPLTPEDLLVALHNIDASACDVKTVIKATALCFAEKHVYTQQVLAVVIQRLMEQDPLPTLLMRTVIQSLALYGRLVGFVMNVLQRLIGRHVWQQRRVWEGFIKCCQRTTPSSFHVLLQLPAEPLAEAFVAAPELRAKLLDHVNSLSEAQRQHVPDDLMQVITSQVSVKVEREVAKPCSDPVSSEVAVSVKEEPMDSSQHQRPVSVTATH